MEDSHSNSQEKKFRCPKENCDFQTNNANSIPNHIKHMHPTDPAQHPFRYYSHSLHTRIMCMHDYIFCKKRSPYMLIVLHD